VIGDGPDVEQLRERSASLGFGARVRWHGAVPGAGGLMAAFDAFVLSSRTEGTPMVLLEAMAAGVPVVATTVGGVPDVVSGGEALLVPPEAPASLAAALRTLLLDPAGARERAAAARARLQAFDAGLWLDRYDAVYRQVARGVPSRAGRA
jgi:glycosyltransferase involved in cell wall biosynthesis